jgi:hypothetical protein
MRVATPFRSRPVVTPRRRAGGPTGRRLTIGLLLLPPGFVALAALGAPHGLAIAAAAVLAAAVAPFLADVRDESLRSGERRALLLLWLALFGWLTWINQAHQQIFGQDVLLVPGIAQGLRETPRLTDAFAASEPGRAYPPSLPILFSPLTLFLTGPRQLAFWALATQAALAALPVLWGCASKRWFRLPLDRLSLSLVLAATMLCLERTAVLGGSIKNAQHVAMGVLLPAVLLSLPRGRGPRQTLAALLLLTGLASAYYMMLHLFVAIVAGWAVGDLFLRRRVAPRSVRRVVVLAGATLVAGLWVAWLLHDLGADPRLPHSGQSISARLWRIFADPRERFWFIFSFMTPDFVGSGHRRIALLAALAACLSLPMLARRLSRAPRRLVHEFALVARFALANAVACLVLVATVALAPLTRLGFDYGRWLTWLPQLFLLAAPFLSAALVLRAVARRRALAVALPVAMIVAVGATAHVQDAQRVHRRNGERGRSLDSIERLARHLREPAPCLVVAESKAIADGLHHVGSNPLSDVVDVVSPCRLATGSFLRSPLPGGRDAGGLPAGAALDEWRRSQTLWAIGGSALPNELATRLPDLAWREVETFSDLRVRLWRAAPAPVARR